MTDETEPQLPAVVWTPRSVEGMNALLPLNVQKRPKAVSAKNIEMSDLVLPELKLCQATTDYVTDGKARIGQYVLTTTGEVFNSPLRVLLVFHSKGRAMFPSEKHPGVEMCLSRDSLTGSRYGTCAECPHKEWPTEDEKRSRPDVTSPACSEQHNFVVLLPQGPAIVRFARTSFKPGKKFITGFAFSNEEIWSNVAVLRSKVSTKKVGNKDQPFAVHEILWDPQDRTPEHVRSVAFDSFDMLNTLHENQKLDLVGDDRDMDE